MVEPSSLKVGEREYSIFRIDGLENAASLPYTLRILLENVARAGSEEGIAAVTGWEPHADPSREIAFSPSRVLLQDLTGVPAVVDLAAMRDALAELGGDPARINPQIPAELVIDHSVQVDAFASRGAFARNAKGRERKVHHHYVAARELRKIQPRPSRPGTYVKQPGARAEFEQLGDSLCFQARCAAVTPVVTPVDTAFQVPHCI